MELVGAVEEQDYYNKISTILLFLFKLLQVHGVFHDKRNVWKARKSASSLSPYYFTEKKSAEDSLRLVIELNLHFIGTPKF